VRSGTAAESIGYRRTTSAFENRAATTPSPTAAEDAYWRWMQGTATQVPLQPPSTTYPLRYHLTKWCLPQQKAEERSRNRR